jgi:hypothetical protein
VQFRLMIELGSDDGFRDVVEVFDVDVIDAHVVANLATCRARIASLMALPDGWHDGSGKSPTSAAAVTASRLHSRKPGSAASYRIFPTDAGGLLFEFVRSNCDYSFEIGPSGKAGNLWHGDSRRRRPGNRCARRGQRRVPEAL